MAAEKRSASKDFQDVVDEFLEKDRVYKPADEFVERLSLCPRYIGGLEKSKMLLDSLMKMVNLVKKKYESSRNKKSHQAWLKLAANTMNTCCLANRDWIEKNVWKLPALPVREVQEYDPEKGTKDIRFLTKESSAPSMTEPAPERHILEKLAGEENAAEELDFNDDLLLESPKKLEQTSSEPMEVDPVSPQRPPVVSTNPRRSPRIAAKVVRFSPVRAPSPTKRSTSANSKKVETQASKKSATREDRNRTFSPSTGYPKRREERHDKPRHSRHSDRSLSRHDDRAFSSSHKEHSRSAGHRRSSPSIAYGTYRSRDYSRSARSSSDHYSGHERSVSIGRGKKSDKDYPQPRVSNRNGKRQASIVEPLTISTKFLKKHKIDDTIRQVREKVPNKETSLGGKKHVKCWVPDCQESARYRKAHAFNHIPSIFDERLPPDEERVLRGREKALNQAARWLLGRPATLDELVTFVVIQKVLCSTDNTEVSPAQEKAMEEFCKFMKLRIPSKFILEPANSPGVLLHWKAVLLIAASLDKDERDYWQDNFPAPEGLEPVEQAEPEPEEVLPEAFDSHFHLDRTLHKLGVPARGLEDIVSQVPVDDDKRVRLVGTVAVYCDADTYPSEQSLLDLPGDMVVAVGLHPRHARDKVSSMDRDIRRMVRLLQNPRVTALGEIGLDHTEPMRHWPYQVELLERILPKLQDGHVLVLHCRGMKGDCGTEAYLLLLHFLKKYVRSSHPIHLHCFTGNQYVVQR